MKQGFRPTLLHLAFGEWWLLQSVTNAGKARLSVWNIVGIIADYHLKLNSPLRGDLMA